MFHVCLFCFKRVASFPFWLARNILHSLDREEIQSCWLQGCLSLLLKTLTTSQWERGEEPPSRGQHVSSKPLRPFKLSSNWNKLVQETLYKEGPYQKQARIRNRQQQKSAGTGYPKPTQEQLHFLTKALETYSLAGQFQHKKNSGKCLSCKVHMQSILENVSFHSTSYKHTYISPGPGLLCFPAVEHFADRINQYILF